MSLPIKFNLRLPATLAAAAKAEAQALGISLNAYVAQAVQNYVPWTRKQRSGWETPPGSPNPKALRTVAPSSRTQPTSRQVTGDLDAEPEWQQRVGVQRVGRNDPCPCGSGRKAKHCHPELC